MTKQKYTITDDTGESIGFLVIEQTGVFEYSTPGAVTAAAVDGPLADAALLFASLVGFTGVAWFLPGPSWIAPTVGLTVTAALAGVRAWRSGGGHPADGDDPGPEVTIKLETWGDEGKVLLDEVQDKTIGLQAWRSVAKAVITDGKNFSRPALAEIGRYVSQGDYRKIQAELTRLNMCHKKGSGYTLSPRGMAFLKKVLTLPY